MKELSFKEVAEKYPDFPQTVMRKIDTAVRGVVLTERALARAKEEGALYSSISQNGEEPNHDTSTDSSEKTSHDKSEFLFGAKSTEDEKSPLGPRPFTGGASHLFGAVFGDGTWVLGLETYLQQSPYKAIRRGDPYVLDLVSARGGGKLWLLDGGEPVEEIHFVPIPKYYGKKTSRGRPMSEVVSARFPNSLAITVLHCHFDREKIPCKFCFYATPFFRREDEKSRAKSTEGASHLFGGDLVSLREEKHTPESLEDIYETVKEALKEEGRWTSIHLVGGSDPRGMNPAPSGARVNQDGSHRGNLPREIGPLNGISRDSPHEMTQNAISRDKPYEKEVEEDIKVLKTLQRCFGTGKIPAVNRNGSPLHQTVQGSLPVRAIASAFPKEQLRRLADVGLSAYSPHIEVWDKKLFEWICPGKAKYFGRQYWIDSILSAVEIFGRGNVSTQLVAGAELAEPYGFKEMDEALASNLEGVEFFARYGVYTTFCILWIGQGSVFYAEKQKLPSLEYYVRLAKGINEIRRKYKLNVDFQDYRRWSNFPDTDLARIDYNF